MIALEEGDEAPMHFWPEPRRLVDLLDRNGFCLFCQRSLSVSRINKFLSRVVARIEPTPKGHGRIAWALIKFEHASIREFQAVIWDRHDCCQDLGLISIPDLDDVAV